MANYNTLNYQEQGGAKWVIGGTLEIAPGGAITTSNTAGVANTGVTAVEQSDGVNHITTLTISKTAAFASGDNASLAAGYLLYTLPAGAIAVTAAYMSVGLTNAEHAVETPDVGIGTLIGSGANATLGAVGPTAENIITGQTAGGCAGTATVKTIVDQPLAIESGGSHAVYLNAACAWANTAGAALNVDVAGTVVLKWTLLK